MAVEYVRASTQYHVTSRLHHRLTGRYGFTISAWYRPDDTTASALVSLSAASGTTARHQITAAQTAGPGGGISMASIDSGGGAANGYTVNGPVANAWNHAFGQVGASNLRRSMLNGDVPNAGSDTNSITSTTHDRLVISARISSGTAGGAFDGGVAHVAVWADYLTLNDGVMLARGANPLSIRPDALVYYYPMTEGGGPLVDLVNGERAAPTNTPTTAIYTGRTVLAPPRKSARIYTFGQPAAGGATAVPVFRHHYVQQGIG